MCDVARQIDCVTYERYLVVLQNSGWHQVLLGWTKASMPLSQLQARLGPQDLTRQSRFASSFMEPSLSWGKAESCCE